MSGSNNTIVIVLDDDGSVCRALKMHLEILGFEVLVFHSAEDLLAGALPPRACLMVDVYLPGGIDGVELCRRLKTRGVHLPTILMSGRDDQPTLQLMREANPLAILFKPFDETALLEAIQKGVQKLAESRA